MIYYVNQTNRDLANFFASIQYNDFTTTSSAQHKGKSFGELHKGFHMINEKFQGIRAEKEANHQLLQTIIEHVDVGLLCALDSGEVIIMNKALQRLLSKSFLVKLESLNKVDPTLYEKVQTMNAGERELMKININNKLLQLSIQAIEIELNKTKYRLFTFQNIKSELEEQELTAWQKLIRILTHEIMNSVAPIASISSTIREILKDKNQHDPETLEQIGSFIGVIQRRSDGLLDFTETYRRLTRIPPPKFQLVNGNELLTEIYTFFQTDAQTQNIQLNLHQPPTSIHFQADPALLEQVLINLVKNAMDAVRACDNPQIDLYLKRQANQKVVIQVSDNGYGIPEDILDQIFVPFFTTKDEGSGIGLSLSRQIMHLHKGEIELHSQEGEGTVARLIL